MKQVSEQLNQTWTIARLLAWTKDYFTKHGIDSPRLTAELLLSYCLSMKRLDIYLNHDKPLSSEELSSFKALIKRRTDREPVAYITGSKGFWSLDLSVTPDVLIPRPDTECLVEAALKILPLKNTNGSLRVIDLGTGSGAVVLSIASDRPDNLYYAVDISEKALGVAKQNKTRNKIDASVLFVNSSWLSSFTDKPVFDLIVSNPPYIRTGDIKGLEPEITGYEPEIALDGDVDGLSCIRNILIEAEGRIKSGGWLMIETGSDQKKEVMSMAEKHGSYCDIEYKKDAAGLDRVVVMRRK